MTGQDHARGHPAAHRPRFDFRPRLRRRVRRPGLPGLTEWFTAALKSPWQVAQRLIPDEQAVIERTLVELVDIAAAISC